MAIRANAFCRRYNDIPLVWCGDFNSQPHGYVYEYLTKGVVNAKAAAPWYAPSRRRQPDHKANVETNSSDKGHPKLTDKFDRLHMTEETSGNNSESSNLSNPKVKYLLDYTLNRFCRWLRILGLDAALETEKEEKERTSEGKM